MTNDVRGFSILMDMEDVGVKRTLNQIKAQFRTLSTEMRRSSNDFAHTDKSMASLKQRSKELAKGIQVTENSMKDIERQLKKMSKEEQQTSVHAERLRTEYSKHHRALNMYKRQLTETDNELRRFTMGQKQGISTMAEIRAKMQSFNDILSLSRSNLSRAGKTTQAYEAHISELNNTMKKQQLIVQNLNRQYDFVAKSQGKNSKEARELASAITQQKIKMNELESEIKQVSVEYKRLSVEQQRAQRLSATAFGRGVQSVNKYKDSISSISNTMRSVGSGAFIYMTVPAVAAMGGAIKSSIEWEQALAGVAKTTNLSGRELNKMGKEITDMSNKLPFAASEVAGVAEAAGQLGVKKKDITAFTKTMLDLGVATNLTSEEAATEFARFANAAKMPIKDVDRLGSTVTALGNSTATTEKEIVEMAQRLAGAGAQAGFSADEIMSISAAMSSLGIESEAGGTAMTQIFNKMTKAVAEGGDTLDSFAKTSGVSAEQFAKAWENNPSKALSMFVEGVSKTEGGAKGVLKALDDVGIKGIREADTIRRMANNHKVLDNALKTGAEGWKKNTALTKEAGVRYATMGSKLKVLKNTFINFLRTIGDAFAPIVIKVADALTALFKRLQNTSDITKIVITAFTLITAAIPPLLIGAGLLGSAITNIAQAAIFLNGTKGGAAFFRLFNGGIKSALPKIGQLITKIPMIGGAVTALSGPIGWAIAAIVAVGVAFVVAYKKVDWFRDGINGLVDVIKVFGGKILSGLTNTVKASIKHFKDWRDSLPKGDLLKKSAVALEVYKSGFKKVMKVLASAKDKATDVSDALGSGVSKSTKKALEGFVKYSEGSDKILAKIKNNHGRITSEEKTELINIQKNMTDELVNQLNIRAEKQRNIQEEVFKQNSGLTAKHEREIMERSKKQFATSEARIREISARIQELVDKQAKDGKLTAREMKELNKLYDEQRDLVVGTLSSTHKEQERILSVMSANREAYGLKEAESIVKNAVKARDVAKKENQKRYDQEVDNINQMVGLSEDEKKRLLQNAQDRYDQANQKADENHQKIIGGVKKNNQEIETEMDLSNGRVYSNSEKWWNRTLFFLQNLWGQTRLLWDVFTIWFTTSVNSIWKSISDKWKAIKDYTAYVWENVKNTVAGKASEMWNSIRRVWDILWSRTVSIFSSIRSWLANTWENIRRSVTGKASSLWNGVRRTWDALWSRTRSIFSSVRSWLINTWNAIYRSVTGIAGNLWRTVRRTFDDMANGLRSIIGRIKGHIDGMVSKIKSGLNSLIRGLNWVGSKLSLPKIPQLSTGTVHNQVINRKVQTTSDGRMKQDTMAIVGDKGPGNGKGLDGRRELIEYPNGRVALTPAKDTTTIIPKGGRVISGSMRQQMMNAGSLPHFSMGTWFGNAKNWIGGKFRDAGDWLQSKLGDVLDFVGKPGKLLDKLLSSLGIDFGSLTRGMGIVGDITRAAWIKIKEGATSWLKKGLDSAGGDIKGGILDPDKISYFFGHTAAYTAATGRYWHEGVDFPFVYQPVRTPMGGKLIRRPFMSGGYGNWVSVISGAMEMIFAHLRDYSRSPASGSTVKAGDVVGLTGSTGFSTGPHLHYGIKLNGRDVNPEPYMRRAKNSGRIRVGKNGAGGLGRITDTVKTALSQTGLPTTKNFVDFWGKKINEQDGTSLLDISKSVFNTFKVKGHNNYNNTLDNLMAGMRYAKATFGRGLIDKDKQFATGGLIKTPGWYNIAEGGYPEYVIPTDPSKKSAAMKLLALAAQDIKMGKTSNNKRPGQLPNITGGPDDTPLLLQMIQNQQIQIDQQRKQMEVLLEIAAKKLTVDEDSMERVHNRFQDKRERRTNKLNKYRGGAFAT